MFRTSRELIVAYSSICHKLPITVTGLLHRLQLLMAWRGWTSSDAIGFTRRAQRSLSLVFGSLASKDRLRVAIRFGCMVPSILLIEDWEIVDVANLCFRRSANVISEIVDVANL